MAVDVEFSNFNEIEQEDYVISNMFGIREAGKIDFLRYIANYSVNVITGDEQHIKLEEGITISCFEVENCSYDDIVNGIDYIIGTSRKAVSCIYTGKFFKIFDGSSTMCLDTFELNRTVLDRMNDANICRRISERKYLINTNVGMKIVEVKNDNYW